MIKNKHILKSTAPDIMPATSRMYAFGAYIMG
jgi:hypothetical protein